MAASQNGWRVLTDSAATHKWTLPGTGRHLVLAKGNAGFVLAWFALWFHHRIEPLNEGIWDEWGWAVRDIRASSQTSNHASGTAMDLNATVHPLGARGTFAKGWMYARIRFRLKVMNGVLRWGGDYRFRADEMHFEVNAGERAVNRLARRLKRTKRGLRLLEANQRAWC